MTHNTELKIDCDFPGGNIVVEKIEGDDVFLHQDLRDTEGHWFYWCFRIRGAAGRKLRFLFTWGHAIGVRGPAISLDNGATWKWLGAGCVDGDSFYHDFPPDAGAVMFSFGMPYQESSLERFLAKFRGDARLVADILCRSRKGRPVEKLRFGCLAEEPRFKVFLTCRHHACEMMANYALEGIIEETLSNSETGRRLTANVEFLAVPFVDKDGVEDGDQGKNRRPHDHSCDYDGDSIYESVAAIKKMLPAWLGNKPGITLDLHCPWIHTEFHEMLMCPSRLRDPENWKKMEPFLRTLEAEIRGPVKYNYRHNLAFTTWDGRPLQPLTYKTSNQWCAKLPGLLFACVLEIPYANAEGAEVNQETARLLGRDIARALNVYLRSENAAAISGGSRKSLP